MCPHLLPPCRLLGFRDGIFYFSSPKGLRKWTCESVISVAHLCYKEGSSRTSSPCLRIEDETSFKYFWGYKRSFYKDYARTTHVFYPRWTGVFGHCSGNSYGEKVASSGSKSKALWVSKNGICILIHKNPGSGTYLLLHIYRMNEN